MIEAEHMDRQPLATSILIGLAVAGVCLAVLWLVLAIGVGMAG